MNLYKIIIYYPDGKYFFHEEEIYCESYNSCVELFELKYPGYVFEIEKIRGV